MNESAAWLLDMGGGIYAAVGRSHLIHLLTDPPLFGVPHTPHYCQKVFLWRDQALPALDLAARLVERPTQNADGVGNLYGVIAFQQLGEQTPQYGGILLRSPPVQLQVSDEQAAVLPSTSNGWQTVSLACFEHPDYGPVPILNLPALFSTSVLSGRQTESHITDRIIRR